MNVGLREGIVSVTKLREHWEETNSKVMQRKAVLDAMLTDSERYEAKRQEVEAWLGRMQARREKMGLVGDTADVLEVQLRDQKVGQRRCCFIGGESDRAVRGGFGRRDK